MPKVPGALGWLLLQFRKLASTLADAPFQGAAEIDGAPGGSTLSLNGLHLYVRTSQIAGTVTGGTITNGPHPIAPIGQTPGWSI